MLNEIVDGLKSHEDAHFTSEDWEFEGVAGVDGVVKAIKKDMEEFPVFLTVADGQLLCLLYLWDQTEVKPDAEAEMMKAMLNLNVAMPLSSFAQFDNGYYGIFGALSVDSKISVVGQELKALASNAMDAFDSMSEYLK